MQIPFLSAVQNRGQIAGTVLTAAILLAAGVLLVLYTDAAFNWQEQPFLGFLPRRTLEVDTNESLVGEEWPALEAGMVAKDRLTELNGVELGDMPADKRVTELKNILTRQAEGDIVEVQFLRDTTYNDSTPPDAVCAPVPDTNTLRKCTMPITLSKMSDGDLAAYFGIGAITGGLLWLVALALFLRRAGDSLVRIVVALSATTVVFLAGSFDAVSTHRLVWVWILASCLQGGLIVMFALEFPYRFNVVQRTPIWGWAPLVAATALGSVGVMLYYATDPNLSRGPSLLVQGALIMSLSTLAGTMAWRRTRSASPIARNQSTMLLIGTAPWLLIILIGLGWQVFTGKPQAGSLVFDQVLPVLFPLSAVYALSQFRLVDTDRVITSSVLYGTLITVLLFSYWLVVAGIGLLIGRSAANTALSPVAIALSIFIIALIFTPLRLYLHRLIDAAYFRARRAYQLYLERFAREVTNAVTLRDVLTLVHHYLDETLAPTHVIMFVRDIVTYEYAPEPDPDTGQRPTDITFGPDSGLVNYLRDRASLLYLEEGRPLPLDVVGDRSRLAVLGAPVIVRLKGQRVLSGFIAIGPRQGGTAYVHEDLRYMESLADQIALAVERAQAIDDLERRVRVQDVISQVSRALNFAIDLDVLLELIYAQTSRVINAPNFYIALRNPNTNELAYVFYNEGDERIETMEGQRWRIGRDLMSEIARTQQTIRTDDYVRETLSRDASARIDNSNLKAWMGVPLLADTGEGVLGVMVAATTEPGIVFTDDQQDLFWDISNLAASAIDKLQLFDKTQQRARQLSAINEISSQLASELGNVDRLLQLITENAVHILGTEAGSLLLVDEESGDLVFHVVVGGGGEELIGQHIPAGSGLVGATVQRGTPIIVNDPSRDARWYGDIQSGDDDISQPPASDNGRENNPDDDFRSGAILSVPLLVQNRAIGVLQTLNKTDSSIFVQEDADLLATFAGQAAIAIENARLFDMTDQQLALRVQELDTMQRIDQELNRTLNLSKVVDITMDWALRKSGASAGVLFILDRERNELRIVASYGYPPESPFYKSDDTIRYPADRGVAGRVVRTGQPSLITDVSIDLDYDETLPNCMAQLTVPLFSANQVIGLIILESDHEGTLDLLDLDFVARLAEHASPAIVNAQLFSELERANQAKSEFVSFVAHELKNPMTSMKGYTDLLLKGVVGPVNEQQSDFLNTIFSNVARMETLVSDLNDLTKQETNNLRLEVFPVDFRNIVIETLRAQQGMLEEKKQELALEVPGDLPLVMGDQNRLIQIMTNFISNANKYTPPGGTITIHAKASRNLWDPQGPPNVIHCYVADTGIGMSQEDLSQLFVPYFRSENPKTREQPGTGLGLTITRGLIFQHGGQIWVESKVDEGTTFHFTIPVATEHERAQV
ncbi:MAG: GAF domain-containing protein [Anaerolineae bacterium]|nr:GAF domain-containing protein [Anaerolineae bacterium]